MGFGMGLERLLMVMEAKGVSFPETPVCEVYFASMGEAAARRCFTLTTKLRQGGVAAECDTVGRSLKAQMKYADKIGARYTLAVGDDELASGTARLKDMATGETEDVTLDDRVVQRAVQQIPGPPAGRYDRPAGGGTGWTGRPVRPFPLIERKRRRWRKP